MLKEYKDYFNFLQNGDPLIIHDADPSDQRDKQEEQIPKTKELQLGIRAIQGHVFIPSFGAGPQMFGGHLQTILHSIKGEISKRASKFEFDKRIVFKYKDGGQCHLDLKGNCFKDDQSEYEKNKDQENQRSILFVLPGLTSESTTPYMTEIMSNACERQFDIVCFNYRGLAGCPVTTPKLYTAESVDDIIEPMVQFHSTYCQQQGRKAMAIGCSMGGNLLANVMGTLGDDSVIDAACVIEAPIKLDEVAKNLSTQLNGVYDKKLTKYMIKCILREEQMFADHFQEHHGIDIVKALKEDVETIYDLDKVFTVNLYGYESVEQYYKKASSINQIPNIRRPTLFIAAVDDPIIGEGGIDKEVFKHNQHTVLATVKTGGHMGFYEDFFSMSSWVKKPALDYLNILRY